MPPQRCVADSAPKLDAGTGVGKCYAPPKPVVRIFLKGSAVPALTVRRRAGGKSWVSSSTVTSARLVFVFIAMAGRLVADDLSFVLESGADIAGVRGAACDEGRTGRVAADRVRLLRAAAA